MFVSVFFVFVLHIVIVMYHSKDIVSNLLKFSSEKKKTALLQSVPKAKLTSLNNNANITRTLSNKRKSKTSAPPITNRKNTC